MGIISPLRSVFVGLASITRARLVSATLVVGVCAAAVGCRKEPAVSPTAGPAPRPSRAPRPRCPPRHAAGSTALLYSSNLQGKYAPCNCAVQPLGGLARRATVTARARAEADATLVVDAGDLFQAEGTSAETERQANLLAAGIARGGIDAFTLGETDLALGVPLLEEGDGGLQDPGSLRPTFTAGMASVCSPPTA